LEPCGHCKRLPRSDAAERHVRTFVVVRPEPASGGVLDLLDGVEKVLAEPIVTNRAVEAFDQAFCCGLFVCVAGIRPLPAALEVGAVVRLKSLPLHCR
jgi:hypothetical protein